MKLCGLLHETTGKCPTCGGKINAQGVDPASLVFPDREGRWVDPDSNKVLHTSDPSDQTQSFQKVLRPKTERLKPKQNRMMQAVLAYRKKEADEERAAQRR